ncbi:hypothetical protein F2Q68_00001965 [Brassica cretica]|uniref:Bicarbonate transporter-like transmembrane domain-containing protein n=1 Tax=Brassica cretica TaxID=69181 RepID=A0A8S9J425_BRACR|nr:hypothetical protein F2Q68_00001965 [Brassica cretica]
MEETFVPFEGIKNDLKGRVMCYKQDWAGGFKAGFRILAPTTYIFFASAIPVISFGEQLERSTGKVSTFSQFPFFIKRFEIWILKSRRWSSHGCSDLSIHRHLRFFFVI